MNLEESAGVAAGLGGILGLLRTKARGDMVPWGDLFAAAGFGRESPHWASAWPKAKRDFRRETGIAIWWFPGVGAKLLTAKEQRDKLPQWRAARAVRQLTRGLNEVAALPDAELGDRARAAKYAQLDRLKAARRSALRQKRAMANAPATGHVRVRPMLPR